MEELNENDAFEFKACILGMGELFIDFAIELNVICYYLTFKKELKSYGLLYYDAFEMPIDQPYFFDSIHDPIVQHCNKVRSLLIIAFFDDLKRRHNIRNDDEMFLLPDSDRYKPSTSTNFKGKSYDEMRLTYLRFLEEIRDSLYSYCCVFTLNSYKIPLEMRVDFDYTHKDGFQHLNLENRDVRLLAELVSEINKQIERLKNIFNADEYGSC